MPSTNATFSDFSSAMVTNINPSLVPPNSVELALNIDFDEEIGSAVSRLGRDIVGAQLVDNMNILGLHQHIDVDTPGNNILFATLNASGGATSKVMNVTAATDVVTSLTANAKMRFLTFLGSTLAINGTDAERAWNGSSWITTGGAFDLGNYPGSNACNLAVEFLDRVYTAATGTTRLHYSTIATSGAITWAGDFIDIEPENAGGGITALAKVPNYILIFKERALSRFNGSSAFPEGLVQIGAPSQEAVVSGGGLCAFYSNSNENDRGFFITDGRRPISISHDAPRQIKKWIDAIPTANDTSVAGWATDRVFAWSVGDLTVDGESYTNVVLKYNYKMKQWSVRSYPSEFKVFAKYITGGVNTIVGGDDDGTIYRMDKLAKYTDDTSTSIKWKLRTHHHNFATNMMKELTDRLAVRGRNLENMTLGAILDEDLDNGYVKLTPDTVWQKLLSFFRISKSIKANTIAIELSGENSANRAYIREIEIPKLVAYANTYTA